MPDSQNPLNQTLPVVPPASDDSFPTMTDLPPLSDSAAPVENQVAANAGYQPPNDMPPVVTPPSGKRKLTPGKMVAGLLGILLLIGGVGAGILLVRQQQDIREKADEGVGSACSYEGQGITGTCMTVDSCASQGREWGIGAGCLAPLGCCHNPPEVSTCEGTCEHTSCANVGKVDATGTCTGGALCCKNNSGGSSPNTCNGSCYQVAGGCVSLNRPNGTGTCSGGGTCCSNATNPPPGGGGNCSGCDGQPDGFKGGCNANQGGQQGTCSCDHWVYNYSATCPNPNAGGGCSNTCHYTKNDATGTIGLAGDCNGYTFRALVFTCAGHLVGGKCSDTIVQDTANATSVSIGSSPSCGSKQADLIVTSRPSCDGKSGDELPGSPVVENFITKDSSSTCGGGSGPISSGALSASCSNGITGTGITAGVSNVHLYFDSGPEDYTANGGDGHAASVPVAVSGGNFSYDLTTASHLSIAKEKGGSVNLADGKAHKVRAFAINFSSNPELGGSNATIDLSAPGCGSTGAPTAACMNVIAYDTNWNLLNDTQLAALKAGSKVRFTITGTKSTGSFTKARFKVNQSLAVETTTTKPGQAEVFYYEYTIPAGVTTFKVDAAIFHSTIGWVPNILN